MYVFLSFAEVHRADCPFAVFPIPGSRNIARAEENACGAELPLTAEDVKAIRNFVETAEVHGDRVPEGYATYMIGDCISLSEWKGEEAK